MFKPEEKPSPFGLIAGLCTKVTPGVAIVPKRNDQKTSTQDERNEQCSEWGTAQKHDADD